MTRSAKGTVESPGKRVRQKSWLNKAILDAGWHQVEALTKYKAYQAGKAVFKISAYQTSQACAACGHTHPENRIRRYRTAKAASDISAQAWMPWAMKRQKRQRESCAKQLDR